MKSLTVPAHLGLYRDVLIAHSDWRWVVIIAGAAAVLSAMMRLSRHEPWAPTGPKLGRLFSIALDIQVLMGAALYLILSPLTTVVPESAVRLPPGSQAQFFVQIHPAIMVIAFIFVHISSVVVRRARSDVAHQRRAIVFYGITWLLVMAGVPWWRPLLRL